MKKILKMPSSSLPAVAFDKERRRILQRAVTLEAKLCAILVPLFGFLDLLLKPHQLGTFTVIRLAVTFLCIVIFFLSKSSYGRNHPYSLAAFLALLVCGSIELMCLLDLGPTDPYYAGINLPLLGFGIMLPLTLSEGIPVFALVWIFYFVPNSLVLKSHELATFVNNNFFLGSTIIISFISSQFNLRYTKNQWLSKRRLQSANRKISNHAYELEEKVRERTQRLLQSERLAVVGQLAGGVAHDFNNILTAILGIGQLLLNSLPQKDPIKKDIENICSAGNRAVDLVKQLLAFSRRQILKLRVINLNDVINDVKKMLPRLIGEDIELLTYTDSDLGNILADPVQIEQIILNLSINARDAMSDGGRLIIKTSNITLDKAYCNMGKVSLQPGNYAMLAVSDTGKGMSEEVKGKVFEPFFTTKESGKGTGLGLASVYGIVKQSNGDIIVYSEENKGTTFKIYFPVIEEPAEKIQKKPKNLSQLPKGKETILLVEDEEDVRQLTARMLKRQGYKIIEASEGRSALNVSESYKGSIDLLMTDIVMPYMNGKVLAKRLVAQRSNMKVLFISGYIDGMINQQGIPETDATFLQKPYTAETLSYKIRNIFDN